MEAQRGQPVPVDFEDLLRQARAGSREALGTALEACRVYLLGVHQRRQDPDLQAKFGGSDLVQETFLEAQRDFPSFQGTTAKDFKLWLCRILLNNLSSFRRRYHGTAKRQARREVSLDDPKQSRSLGERLLAAVNAPEEDMMRRELAEAVRQAALKLSPRSRAILHLRSREQLSFEELGLALGCSAEAARKRWQRTLTELADNLPDRGW